VVYCVPGHYDMKTKETLYMYSKKILVVDDTPLFIKLAKDFFRREQVEILTAEDGDQAVAIVKQEKPDLVFMDLYMPKLNGDEACRQIKSDFEVGATPIVIVTSSSQQHDLERCLAAGCNDIVHKPLTREDCLNTSRKFITFPKWSGQRGKINVLAMFAQESAEAMQGTLRDISVGGVFLETPIELPVDTTVSLAFRLRADSTLINCRGRVAWLNRKFNLRKDYGVPGLGIEFIDIKKMDLFNIQTWIKKQATPSK